jgi:hypothetical protein
MITSVSSSFSGQDTVSRFKDRTEGYDEFADVSRCAPVGKGETMIDPTPFHDWPFSVKETSCSPRSTSVLVQHRSVFESNTVMFPRELRPTLHAKLAKFLKLFPRIVIEALPTEGTMLGYTVLMVASDTTVTLPTVVKVFKSSKVPCTPNPTSIAFATNSVSLLAITLSGQIILELFVNEGRVETTPLLMVDAARILAGKL